MDQNKIDRLFREKMDNLEVMPFAGAWSQVEKQIRPKRAFKAYWLAAAVALVFASWVFWPSQSEVNQTPIASEVSYPPILESPEFDFTEIKVVEAKKETRKKLISTPSTQLVAKVEEPKKETETAIIELAPIEIDAKTAVATSDLERPEIIQEIENANVDDFTAVKIIYIASAKNATSEGLQTTDSVNAFKKIIAFAERIDPGEIMADFKSAKDNLLNNGFKKKEKNSL